MNGTLPLVTLYLSERCNSRCISCDYWRNGERDMSFDSVERLVPELEALGTRVVLISGGEPLVNREWPEIAAVLRAHGLELWLLTSGLALAKHAHRVAALFTAVTVSLDGASRETYAAIRGVDAFDNVCAGIRAVAARGTRVGIRVTLQRRNYAELASFVEIAHALGASEVSFLAVDVGNAHAFARGGPTAAAAAGAPAAALALRGDDVRALDRLIFELERDRAADFRSGFIVESPAKLRRIRDYFAALLGQAPFPPVRCNAPAFSAVVSAAGRVAPCFFIDGPAAAPRAPALRDALASAPMRTLRGAIAAGERPECERCVCSMWRDPGALEERSFLVRGHGRA